MWNKIQSFKFFNLLVFASILCIAFLLRVQTFELSSLNIDESAYVLGGRSILQGAGLYFQPESAWDHKPPLIYLFASFFVFIAGADVAGFRWGAMLFISLSSFFLYKIGKDRLHSLAGGICSALFYLFFTLRREGLSSNTEVFYNLFIILGFNYLLAALQLAPEKEKLAVKELLFCGIFMSIGIQIKYNLAIDLMSMGLILSIFYLKQSGFKLRTAGRIIKSGLLMGAPVLGLYLIFFGYYSLRGYMQEYLTVSIKMNLMHSGTQHFFWLKFLQELGREWAERPVQWFLTTLSLLLPAALWLKGNREQGALKWGLWLWLFCGFCNLYFLKNLWDHYFIHLFPPLALLSGLTLAAVMRIFREKQELKVIVWALILFFSFYPTLHIYSPIEKNAEAGIDWDDTPRKVAELIGWVPDSYIFVANYDPMIYYLTGARLPTKFCFVPFLMNEHYEPLLNAAGSTQVDEMARIKRKFPEYIVFDLRDIWIPLKPEFKTSFLDYLKRYYILENEYNDVLVYKKLSLTDSVPD